MKGWTAMAETADVNTWMSYILIVAYYAVIAHYWLSGDDSASKGNHPDADAAKTLAGPVSRQQPSIAGRAAAGHREHAPDRSTAVSDGIDQQDFISGATRAFEAIVTAFAAGDVEALQGLVGPDVLAAFGDAIARRDARGERSALDIVGVKAEIVASECAATQGEMVVRFTSELVRVTHGADGAVVDGDPETVVEVVDEWTFARDLSSKDPNWTLVATASEDSA
jgi:predicted lipid-binding transport protein (Tim44 family)